MTDPVRDQEQVWRRTDREHAAGSGACRRPEGPGRACDHSEDSRREGNPKSFTHVAIPFRRVVPDSAPNIEKLGAGAALTRRTRGGLLAGDSTPTEGSHGSCHQLIADFSVAPAKLINRPPALSIEKIFRTISTSRIWCLLISSSSARQRTSPCALRLHYLRP